MSVESTILGISLAVASAISLSAGNIWQSRGVKIAAEHRGSRSTVSSLLHTRVWLIGALMFGLSIVLQMSSLAFAPLMLVQPIGVLALVFSVFINSKLNGVAPSITIRRAVAITLIGVAVYVAVASSVTSQRPITDGQLVAVLCALGIALLIAATIRLVNRGGSRRSPIIYVLLGGMFSAFVAALGKTVLMRVEALFAGHHFSLDNGGGLTIACLVGLGVASALSIYFTQTAYTCNPSDVVVAGLTVVDPAIAVMIGILILHEAATAPLWSFFVIAASGAVALYGVIRLARAETTDGTADASTDAGQAGADDSDPDPTLPEDSLTR